ncbi:MAG: NUDIX hydrolase [Candidatus Pacebacteria bacterium]|nr:NUDIX hydrolase [Candidatus Paceibacterota bacterium]
MNEYYRSLPKKRMGAGALIFNKNGELLIVKPNYKDYWSIPGGTVEENESPRTACLREVKEEVGIDIADAEFVSVDYLEDADGKGENLQFTFFGGIIKDGQKVSIDKSELDEYRFASADVAKKLFGKNLATRLSKCIDAIQDRSGVYLENGA